MAHFYSFGYTAASLRSDLTGVLAEHYLEHGSWIAARKVVLVNNAFQCRSQTGAIRLERELRQRLETLTSDQLELVSCLAAQKIDEPGGGENPSLPAPTSYIRANLLRAICQLPFIATERDLNRWLASLKEVAL